jgi:hypothetical protein
VVKSYLSVVEEIIGIGRIGAASRDLIFTCKLKIYCLLCFPAESIAPAGSSLNTELQYGVDW